MRVAVLSACAALLAAPAAADAATDYVSMPGKLFSPAQLTVVGGDEVVFRNSDFTGDEHDVRASGGAFATGRLPRYASHRQPFTEPGSYDYVCTIHPGMAGNISVVPALLEAPAEPAFAGEVVTLGGRAVAGPVAIERQGADGAWLSEASVVAGADGAFSAQITPREPGLYRAVSAAGASAPVAVGVLSGLHVQAGVRRRAVRVAVHPAPAGAWAVLERYVRERFAWRRVARARLTEAGVRFRVPRARGLARVVVERRRGAPPLAVGDAFRLRDGRPARDPTAGDVPAGGHEHGERP